MRKADTTVRKIQPNDLSPFLPRHQKVTEILERGQGNVITGILKIHCQTDRKTFASDFEAHLKDNGEIETLYVNGKRMGKGMKCG